MYRFRPGIVRELYWALEQPFSRDRAPMSRVVDYRFAADVSSAAGDEIGLRVYYPSASVDGVPRPAMVYYHGGGCNSGLRCQ
jgi:acetyl esterase/lipase